MSSLPMLEQLKAYWSQLSKRDQSAVKWLAGFLSVLILLYGVAIPSYEYHHNARVRYINDTQLLEWLKQQELEINKIPAQNTSETGNASKSLLTVVTNTSKKHELTLKRVQPENEKKLRFWIESASVESILVWIEELEDMHLRIDSVVLERSDEAGVASIRGLVSKQ